MINDFKKSDLNRVVTFCLIILLFISENHYLLFILLTLLFLFFLIYFDLLKNLTVINYNLFKIFPLVFYIQRLSSIFINQNKSIFWDMQLFLFELNCQNDWSLHYTYKYSDQSIECTSLGFGPFSRYIYGPFSKFFGLKLDPWNTSLFILAFLFIFFVYLIYRKINQDLLFLNLMFTFPPFLFLFETLNHDLIFLYCFLLLLNEKKIMSNNSYLFLLTILTLFKIYTISLLLGELIYRLLNKQRISKILIVTLLNISILLWYYRSLNLDIPNPISKVLTFGFLHDLKLLQTININYYFLYIILFFVLLTVLISLRKKINLLIFKSELGTWNKDDTYLSFLFLFLGLFVNSYSNYGYKFSLNILIVLIIAKYLTKNALAFFIFIFSMIPIQYFVGTTLENNLFEILFFILNKFAFYGFFFFIILLTISIFENKKSTTN